MKIKCIGCEALTRVIYHCAALSPHKVDVRLFKLGLHNQPENLRATLQQEIDDILAAEYDAIVLGYGLCGKATAGLRANALPIIIPRAHDCITLFLGSRDKYNFHTPNKNMCK